MKPPTFWTNMRNYFRAQWGLEMPPEGPVAAASPLRDLLEDVEETRGRVLDAVQGDLRERLQEEAHREELERTEAQRAALYGDILHAHRQLETGLDDESLADLSRFILEHWKETHLEETPHRLSEITLRAIVERIHGEALGWAWQDFESRRSQHGLSWPDPLGLSPHASSAEVSEHRRLELQQFQRRFVQGPVRRFADLMQGTVPAWGSVYPEAGGPVWIHSVYEAVAAALASRRLHQLDQLAHQHRQHLEQELDRALEPALRPIQERLAASAGSVAEAARLSEEIQSRCRQLAPEVVWSSLQRLLEIPV